MLNKAMPFDDTNIKRLYEQQTNKKWKFRAKVENVLSDQVSFVACFEVLKNKNNT